MVDKLRFGKNDFKLKEGDDFGLWKDRLKSELRANDCMFIIDADQMKPEKYSEKAIERIKAKVCNLIVANLEDRFH